MTSVYFWTILAFLVVLVWIAVRSYGNVSTQEDFSVAGRKLSVFLLFGTMLATWIGTGSIFGNAEKTARVGLAAWILPVGSLIGIWVLSLLAGRVRGLQQITVQDILEQRYNAIARVFGVVALLIAYTTIVSYQYRAAGAVLNLALPELSYDWSVRVSAGFIILFTAFAGMVSLARIGLVQGITMIVGISTALPVLFWKAGGVSGMKQVLDPSRFEFIGPIGPIEALGLVLPPFLLVLSDANMYQRFSSARSEGVARRAVLWTLAGVAFMEFAIIATAWVSSALEPELEIQGRVVAYAARDHLPVFLGALVLTTIMAIVLSTAASFLLCPATALIRDIYERFIDPAAGQRQLVFLLRTTVVGLGIIAYYLSTLSDEFLSVALLAYTIYGAAITPALLAAFLWRRATGSGAVASIAAGTLTTLIWKWKGPPDIDPVLPAIALSVLALVVVSLFDSPPPKVKTDPFQRSQP